MTSRHYFQVNHVRNFGLTFIEITKVPNVVTDVSGNDHTLSESAAVISPFLIAKKTTTTLHFYFQVDNVLKLGLTFFYISEVLSEVNDISVNDHAPLQRALQEFPHF